MAIALGIRIGAVKARLHKARASLRVRLLEETEEVVMLTAQATHPVEVRVADVRRTSASHEHPQRFVVVLEEKGGLRRLPIWISPHEGTSIALYLEKVELPRPHAYVFLANVLQAIGGRMVRATVSRLQAEVFYAVATISSAGGKTVEIDARPSDVINLVLATGSPLFVDSGVLELASQSGGFSREPLTDQNSEGRAAIAAEAKQAWQWPRK
jgi:bifunctional DNase/RNase